MKPKWITKRLTLLIIPDANSNVRKLRIPGYFPAAALSAMLAVSSLCLTALWLYGQASSEGERMRLLLSEETARHKATDAAKDAEMEKLQSQVVELSAHAESLSQRMAEMKRLEDEMKTLTEGKRGVSAVSSAEADTVLRSSGQGGVLIPATQAEIDALIDQTREKYEELEEEMGRMSAEMSSASEKAEELRRRLAVTPTIWPADTRTVTSVFGYRTDPLTGRAAYHNGIDIGGSVGDPVYAAADGKVLSTDDDSLHGRNIVVSHGSGIRTWYMHLDAFRVKPGESVVKGQIIGLMGNTGRSTGPHLHYEVIRNGTSVDPKPFLKQSRKEIADVQN